MGGFKLTISGINEVIAKLDPKEYEEKIQVCFNDFGTNAARLAQLNAPVDEDLLRSKIYSKPLPLASEVGCAVDYAAYLEFGTRKFAAEYVATLPELWQEVAARHKGGGGGTFEQLVLAITEWIHRKGLGSGFAGDIGITGTYSIKTRKRTGSVSTQQTQDKQIAYLIARKILRDGIPAQPFLYPAVNEALDQLLKDLKNIKID